MVKYRIKVKELNSGEKTYEVQSRDMKGDLIVVMKHPLFWIFLPITLYVLLMLIFEYNSGRTFDDSESAKEYVKELKERESIDKEEKEERKRVIKLCKTKRVSYIKIK